MTPAIKMHSVGIKPEDFEERLTYLGPTVLWKRCDSRSQLLPLDGPNPFRFENTLAGYTIGRC